jgi:regulator of RNase E activity RraA
MAKERKVAGIVIFGAIRDLAAVKELDVPVYALGVSAGGPLKGWGGNINYPIACGGAVVNPGDIVAGDDDGIVVIPQELASELSGFCKRRKAQEEEWIARVKQGESTLEILNLNTKLKSLGVEFE